MRTDIENKILDTISNLTSKYIFYRVNFNCPFCNKNFTELSDSLFNYNEIISEHNKEFHQN